MPEELITSAEIARAAAGRRVAIMLIDDIPEAPLQVLAVAWICESDPGG